MSQIHVEKCTDIEKAPKTLTQKIETMMDSIRQRAFSLFERRGGAHGSDLDDWLQAERDVFWSPSAELVDDGKEFKVRLAAPGFEAKDVQVSAMPDALIIQAGATHTHKEKEGNVCFCEFSDKQMFRRLPLPADIDVDHVTASIDKGILQVTAPKAIHKQIAAGA